MIQSEKNLDNKTRMESFLKIFPEYLVNNFASDLKGGANFRNEIINRLAEYDRKKDEELLKFYGCGIKKFQKRFNRSFENLNTFLIHNFWIPRVHYQEFKNPPLRYLLPRIHHNFRLTEGGRHQASEEDSREWDRKKEELDELVSRFHCSYKKFLKAVKKRVEKDLKQQKWWERSWIQVLMIVGAIVSVVGGVVLVFTLL